MPTPMYAAHAHGLPQVCTAPEQVGLPFTETEAPIGPKLVNWYARQGYMRVGGEEPCYWTEVIQESLVGKVHFQKMRKPLIEG